MIKFARNIMMRETRGGATAALRKLPRYVNGTLPDIKSYGKVFKNYFAHALLEKIHDAFVIKSIGGTDETGLKWKPLKRETIAQRPLQPGEAKQRGIQYLGRSGRGLLTAQQNKEWKGIFWSVYKRLVLKIGEAAAKAEAAKQAWAIMKSRGAKTKLDVLGGRNVPILIVSGRLEKSLRPGSVDGTEYRPPAEQVFQRHWGGVTIGTEVEYAAKQHKTRPLWPTTAAMTRSGWLKAAIRTAFNQVAGMVKK